MVPAAGTCAVVLSADSGTPVSYDFTAADNSDPPKPVSGFDAIKSGTLDAGASAVFHFTGPAGRFVFFDGRNGESHVSYTLAGPNGSNVLSGNTSSDTYLVLPQSGAYTLTLNNNDNTSQPYSFRLIDMQGSSVTPLTLGQDYTGGPAAYADDVYSFQGTVGQQAYLNLFYSSSANAVSLQLVGPGGSTNVFTGRADYSDSGPVTLLQTGTYYVIAGNNTSGTPAYRFHLLDTSSAPAVTVGTPVSGTLNADNRTDLYRLTGQAGQQFVIQSNTIYVNLDVYSLDNNRIGSLGGGGGYGFTNVTLPADGTYVVAVKNAYQTGTINYTFTVRPQVTNTIPLTLGATVSSSLAQPGQVDRYTFTGSRGQRIYFDGLGGSGSLSVSLTPPDGYAFFGNTIGSYDEGPFTLTEDGQYALEIDSGSFATGSYSFRLLDVSTATPLALGTTTTGTLDPSASTNLYALSGTAGERLFLSFPANSPISFTLYGPDNKSVDPTYSGNSREFILPTDGTYVLTASTSPGNEPVDYSFRAALPPTNNFSLTVGKTVNGNLTQPGQIDNYTFTGSAGQDLYFEGLMLGSSTNVVVTGPDGAKVSFNPWLRLAEDGTYTVQVRDTGDATGRYSFRLLDLAAAPQLTLNTPVNDILDPGDSTNLYQFTGTAGQRLFISWPGGSASGNYELDGPDGKEVAGSSLGSPQLVTLPEDGRYSFAVTSTGGSPITYTFQVATPPQTTTPLVLGEQVSGTLAQPGQIDGYTFTGSVGQRLYFDNLAASLGLSATLTGPDGSSDFSTALSSYYADTAPDAGPITLTAAGTYSLAISSSSNQTGPYNFRLLDLAAQHEILAGAIFTVTLSQPATSAVTAHYATQDNTALAGTDYVAASGNLVFNPGETSQSLDIYTLPDPSAGGVRTFFVNLSATGVNIAAGQGVGIIEPSAPVPSALRFVQQPGDTKAGSTLGMVKVQILDQFNNALSNATTPVTLSLGNNPAGGQLGGTLTQNAVNGVATFADLTLDQAASGYTLVASSGSLDQDVSASFTISPAAASKVAFAVQPSLTIQGQTMQPAVTVLFTDHYGNVETSDSDPVTVALGKKPGGGLLGGTVTEKAQHGIATFGDLSIDKAGLGYTLTAASGQLTGDTSTPFTIYSAARGMEFVQQPSTTVAGVAIAPAVTVEVVDAQDQLVGYSTAEVTLALGQYPGSAKLGGTLKAAAVNGIATFDGVTLDQPDSGYTLTAGSAGLTGATSAPFLVTPAVPASLQFVQQPAGAGQAQTLAPVTVEVLDTTGRPASDSVAVTLSLYSPSGQGKLSGTLTQTTVSGVATFNDLSVDREGDYYSLTASARGLSDTSSQSFSISSVPFSSLAFKQQPANVVATRVLAPVTVDVLDASGKLVTLSDAPVTLKLGKNPGGAKLGGTTTIRAVGGVATFKDLTLDQPDTGYTLLASSGSVNNIPSDPFDVLTLNAPALAVQNLRVSPSTGVQTGSALTVQWDDANTGNQPTTGSWADYITVKNETTGQLLASGPVLYDAAAKGAIQPGSSQSRQYAFTVPDGSAGAGLLTFTVTADYFNQQTIESGNTADVQVQAALAAYPDLAVSDVTAPAFTIGNPANVTLGWTVTNVGTGATGVSSWTDDVIASPDDNPAEGQVIASLTHQGALGTNGTYKVNQQFVLPPDFQGSYHLFVRTDATGLVFENGATANNTAEAGNLFVVTPKPYADLVVTSLAVPATGSSGQPLQVSWTVKNQGIGVTDSSEWSDAVSLSTDPAGQDGIVGGSASFDHLGALAVGQTYSRTAQITVPEGVTGPVYVTVHAAAAGGGSPPFEFLYADNNTRTAGPVAVSLTPAPDLTVTDIQAPSGTIAAGTKADVTWTVHNAGPGDTTGYWTDDVTLVESGGGARTFDLGQFTYSDGLSAGKSYTRSEQVTLPDNAQGLFQFVVTTEIGSGNGFYDPNQDTKTRVDPDTLELTLGPKSDLQVFSVDAPSTGQAGGTIDVSFVVINQGIATTTPGHWTDNVYLSYTQSIDASAYLLDSLPNGSALDHGQEYKSQAKGLVIPVRFSGPGYVIVQTGPDANEANTDNNTFAVPITISPLPPADLVLGGVGAPDQVYDGSTIQVTYTVTNKGSAATDISDWTDTVWLTTDKTRPNPSKGDVLLGSFPHSGGLDNSDSVFGQVQSYTQTVSVTLPKHIAGQYYLTPWTDSYGQVLQDTFDVNINPDDPHAQNSDNYKARAVTVLLTPPPDLVVTSVVPTAQAVGGQPFTVTWTVHNQGSQPTEDADWGDAIYLSDGPAFDGPGVHMWFLGLIPHSGVLASGADYTAQQTFNLSPDVYGRYVTVVTNVAGLGAGYEPIIPATWEGPYTENNRRIASTDVTTAPADLTVTSVVTPQQNYSGEKATIQWTVENVGAPVWPGTQYWTDRVYFSPDPTFDGQAQLMGQLVHSNDQPLGTDQSYTASLTITLPRGTGGKVDPLNYYVYVTTDLPDPDASQFDVAPLAGPNGDDYRATVYEGDKKLNNLSSASIPILYREPALQVTSLTVPQAPALSGDTITVSWTVTNTGTHATRVSAWKDGVYLSTDPSLHSDDILLGELWHSGGLDVNGSYSASLNVPLPENIKGNFYIVVFTDSNLDGSVDAPGIAIGGLPTFAGQAFPGEDPSTTHQRINDYPTMGMVQEFGDEGHNTTAAPFTILPRQLPDLQVTSVQAPQHVLIGQQFNVTYTVTNKGTGDTRPSEAGWTDEIYLSLDPHLDFDGSDPYLGFVTHTGGLTAGSDYKVTQQVTAPTNLIGAWYVIVVTDPAPYGDNPHGQVFEANENNNNTAAPQPTILDVPDPTDLQIQSVTIPPTAQTGQTVEIKWTVKNISQAVASGSWTDAAYLATGAIWNINDPLIGEVTVSPVSPDGKPGLQPDELYTATLDAVLPVALPGQYRVIVRDDIFNDLVQTPDNPRDGTSQDVMNVTAPALQLGVPLDTTLSSGEDRLYQVTVAQGQTLEVDLTTPATQAANEEFIRFNALPSGTQYDAIYQGPLQPNQTLTIPTTQLGTYYLLVRGDAEPADNTPITLLAHVLPFEITDVTPDNGGDSRYVTTTIHGAQFDPQAIVKLVRPGFAELEPVSYQVVNSTVIIAIFDFSQAPLGLYDLEVINPDGSSDHQSAVHPGAAGHPVAGPGGPRLGVQVGPAAVRRPVVRHWHPAEQRRHRPAGHRRAAGQHGAGQRRSRPQRAVPSQERRRPRRRPAGDPAVPHLRAGTGRPGQPLGHHRRRAAAATRPEDRRHPRPVRRGPDAEPGHRPGQWPDLRLVGQWHRDLQPHHRHLHALQRHPRRRPGLRSRRQPLGRELALQGRRRDPLRPDRQDARPAAHAWRKRRRDGHRLRHPGQQARRPALPVAQRRVQPRGGHATDDGGPGHHATGRPGLGRHARRHADDDGRRPGAHQQFQPD
jgi:subtilase family serine protease